ncbi:hypothetical protein [Streptomyces sp. H27-C3]|uniref:hypothetical protein n=1 Tax=Streptomyces sp. H27-C3 TaxID=3046305 RepID=UPI0024B8841E|nr:hypothetical protein [Streptomyces sp. H27-C3]MDJ0466766.1 hypothetical protein [Streptomyces sp. H27-C3]
MPVCVDKAVVTSTPVRRQRVRVPMRLVSSPSYADVAVSVYVKVKALGARPEECQAKAVTIASYMGLSKASVERGLTALSRAAPDGVIELKSERRTSPGGRGTSAVRRTRPMSRAEAFVWVPVAAAEDLTPRQLRAFAVIAYAQAMRIALTEGELAGSLFHHSGKKAGQTLTATAAGEVVDELEAARWVSVQRRAGAYGRHRFAAHDLASAAGPEVVATSSDSAMEVVQERAEKSADTSVGVPTSSLVGEGSGPQVREGSLVYEESPRTDSPDDERVLLASAVGEIPVVEAVENPEDAAAPTEIWGGLALRADGNSQPALSRPNGKGHSDGRGSAQPSYTGPQLAMDPMVYAVLEPVHWLLSRVNNPFMERQIAREVGRQLRDETAPQRLQHRLTVRFARTSPSEIRDTGRWLLGVALPRWGCGHFDCEAGTMWSTGRRCDVCAENVAARYRAQRTPQNLCLEHGPRPGPAGTFGDGKPLPLHDAAATVPVQNAPDVRQTGGAARAAAGSS